MNNLPIQDIITPRIPPCLWDIFICLGGLLSILYFNLYQNVIFYSVIMIYTISYILIEYNFIILFEYEIEYDISYFNELGCYKLYITNFTPDIYTTQEFVNNEKGFILNTFDCGKINIKVSLYVGDKIWIKYLIYWIYKLGITKRNYTMKSYEMFKDNRIMFV
jgi:hypothetical protein